MKLINLWAALATVLVLGSSVARADSDADTVELFKNAGDSAEYFAHSAGYALFPNVAKGGIGIGGAYGKGSVYVHGKRIGKVSMKQLSLGLQLGGQAYSQIIFFEDQRAVDEFTSGNFEFGAGASVVALTAGASASAGTGGGGVSASGGKKDASTSGGYYKGMAVFTIAKGGLMYEASVAGQKFKYEPTKH